MDFVRTALWQKTLAEQPNDSLADERARLRSSYLTFWKRAGLLAREISISVPQLTEHDLSHIDALWELADEILSDLWQSQPTFINPLEAFVLGSALLVHDLAQSEAALPQDLETVRASTRYRDVLQQVLNDKEKSSETIGNSIDQSDHRNALLLYLRGTHAELAKGLVSRHWVGDNGAQHFLLMDEELRQFLANSIGRLAASHHLSVDRLASEFSTPVGSPPFLHFGDCDLLKLSTIIRTADALNYDARRAPSLVACFRKIQGESKRHWAGQQYLHKARFQGDRVFFTSDHAFSIDERDAWWHCYDAMGTIDSELLGVDTLLTDLGRPRLRCKSVAGAASPRRLRDLIPTAGWIPVDTQIRVNNVVGLVTRLGGQELYGKDLTVPLRELGQNARDAIKARSVLEGNSHQGCISISLDKAKGSWKLTVEDSGVGMSEAVLSGPLLDFGTSFWASDLARTELPGLQSSQFIPSGRYGIGFFSVFMMGTGVTISTRRFDQGRDGARVLQFTDGLKSRPILRALAVGENIPIGTRIEIILKEDPYELGGLLAGDGNQRPKLNLAELAGWLFPSIDVDIRTKELRADWLEPVKANDWLVLDAQELLNRMIKRRAHRRKEEIDDILTESAPFVRTIITDGQVVARACILATNNRHIDNATDLGVVTVGGSRAKGIHRLGGIFQGTSTRAARDAAKPVASDDAISNWASEQASLISKSNVITETKANVASVVRGFAGDVQDLPIAWCTHGWLNKLQIAEYVQSFNEVFIISDASKSILSQNRKINFLPSVLVTSSGRYSGFGEFDRMKWEHPESWEWNGSKFHFWTSQGAVMEAMAEGWAIDIQQMFFTSLQTTDEKEFIRTVAHDENGTPVTDRCDVFFKPQQAVPSATDESK